MHRGRKDVSRFLKVTHVRGTATSAKLKLPEHPTTREWESQGTSSDYDQPFGSNKWPTKAAVRSHISPQNQLAAGPSQNSRTTAGNESSRNQPRAGISVEDSTWLAWSSRTGSDRNTSPSSDLSSANERNRPAITLSDSLAQSFTPVNPNNGNSRVSDSASKWDIFPKNEGPGSSTKWEDLLASEPSTSSKWARRGTFDIRSNTSLSSNTSPVNRNDNDRHTNSQPSNQANRDHNRWTKANSDLWLRNNKRDNGKGSKQPSPLQVPSSLPRMTQRISLQRDFAPHQRPVAPHLTSNVVPKEEVERPYQDRRLAKQRAERDDYRDYRSGGSTKWQRTIDPEAATRLDEQAQKERTKEERLKMVEALSVAQDTFEETGRSKHTEKFTRKSGGSRLRQWADVDDSTIGPLRQESKPNKKTNSASKHKQTQVSKDVYIPTTVTVERLAQLLELRLETLQRKMNEAGLGDENSYDHVLPSDIAALLAEEFGFNGIVDDEAAFDLYPPVPHPNPETLPLRPPVVTIMGHVDHGKTTLLDNLRSTSVAKGEAGGITQHIGAFSVPVKATEGNGPIKSITFLDTPGHAAFSAMRARGARVTDVIVLVVAADDGIMPQTREVLEIIKKDWNSALNKTKLGVVVAINKIDKPEIDIEYVQRELLADGLQLETFDGDVPSVNVSGLTGQGLPDLVETLSAVAELKDLRAERDDTVPVHGYVLEARVQKGLGSVATVLVIRGCLKPGTHLIAGTASGKVRLMFNSANQGIKAAYPGDAVTVSGWKVLPDAGDEVLSGSEGDIKKAITNRERKKQATQTLQTVEEINETRRKEREKRVEELAVMADAEKRRTSPRKLMLKMRTDEAKSAAAAEEDHGLKELPLIIKADVSGSAEAVSGALLGIGNHQASTKIVSEGVGDITESDIRTASSANGVVVAFSVKVPRDIEVLAETEQVPIVSSPIIYRLMDDIRERVIKLLPVITETKVTAEVDVLQIFDIKGKQRQIKKIAGCKVGYGTINKADSLWVLRGDETVFDGKLETLRIRKDDVTEVRKGFECGLGIDGFEDIRAGDRLKFYQTIEKPGVL